MTEQWRPVIGYEGLYEVSDLGRVKNIAAGQGRQPGKVLKASPHKQGYRLVGLNQSGKRQTFKVHVLVARAFLGPCPTGMEVNHKDGLKHRNDLTNLEYLTPKQNTEHAITVLYRPNVSGEKHGRAKITWDDVDAIRSANANGGSLGQLAKQYNMSKTNVSRIVKHKIWAIALEEN